MSLLVVAITAGFVVAVTFVAVVVVALLLAGEVTLGCGGGVFNKAWREAGRVVFWLSSRFNN